ncbi:DUF551 domain-containing protein [Pedobacter sp. SYSU D00535]|uniref:DUF551 domain-containing protein n=1 Tax=Pedobacter sp. SYSU D00535 TaxID=2810308 RepID=UPI001A95D94E|nr:DUF551 domain-containing protein [Pedobacter sp. SYSU D00535]
MKDNNIREAAEKLTKALEILNSRHKDTTGLGAVITLLKEVKGELTKAEGEKEEEGWISCEDRLPDDKQYIIIYCQDDIAFNPSGRIAISYFSKKYGFNSGVKVTHWMPLPTPPKG